MLYILLSAIANVAIGSGIAFQKLALKRISLLSNGTRNAQSEITFSERFKSSLWRFAFVSTYLAEAANFIALGNIPTSIIAPLGILAVIANAFLSVRFLGEKISGTQVRAYILLSVGVLVILTCSPKSSNINLDNVIYAFTSYKFKLFVFLVAVGISYHAFCILVRGQKVLMKYVAIIALLGSITVSTGKFLSILVQSSSLPASPAPSVQFIADNSTATPHTQSTSPSQQEQQIILQDPTVIPSFLPFLGLLIFCTVLLEIIKQKTLARFPASQFQPLFYALYNMSAVVSSAILFNEIGDGIWENFVFLTGFVVGLFLVMFGARRMQGEEGSGSSDWKRSLPLRDALRLD